MLFFKIKILPDKDNKFDVSKLKKKKKENQPPIIKNIKDAEADSPSLLDKLNSIREIIAIVFNEFKSYLHVKLTKIHVSVATDDAAKTAILYGAVSTAVACIVDLIDDITNLKTLKESSISVEPDFLSSKTDIDLNITLYVSILGAIKILMKSFIQHYLSKNETQINNRKEN